MIGMNYPTIKQTKIIDDQHEGLMIKNEKSSYIPGRPKGYWYKWKKDPKMLTLF